MKKFLLGFVAALILSGLLFMSYPIIRGFFENSQPIAPDALNPAATDFGTLRVTVAGAGQPVKNLEADVGVPGGRMSYASTDGNGVVVFERISVGTYTIFFNDLNFPKQFARVSSPISVRISKDQTTVKEIDLAPR